MHGQFVKNLLKLNGDKSKNISVKNLNHNPNASTFLVWVKDTVTAHKHIEHNELVYILKGKGKFHLGEESFNIKKGDVVFVPKNTFHSVQIKSRKMMQVLSVQTPYFDGTDRHFKN